MEMTERRQGVYKEAVETEEGQGGQVESFRPVEKLQERKLQLESLVQSA